MLIVSYMQRKVKVETKGQKYSTLEKSTTISDLAGLKIDIYPELADHALNNPAQKNIAQYWYNMYIVYKCCETACYMKASVLLQWNPA